MYTEYPPDMRLSTLVDCYWHSYDIVPDDAPQRIPPDGCVDIIFSFSNDNTSDPLQHGLPFLNGTMTHSIDSEHTAGITEMIGIRFLPAGITAFMRMPVSDVTNRHTDLSLVDTLFDSGFYEELSDLPPGLARITYLNQYLLRLLPGIYTIDKRIIYATGSIMNTNGMLPVKEITNSVCLSERQFERIFKHSVGVSIKTFSRIARFIYTSHYLRNHPGESLYQVALECGYYDHSHLIRDYKRFAGELP